MPNQEEGKTGREQEGAPAEAAGHPVVPEQGKKARVTKDIVLWGQPAIDWLNVSRKSRPHVFLSAQAGGIALLYRLLEEMLGLRVHEPRSYKDTRKQIKEGGRPLQTDYNCTWSLWRKRGKPHRHGKPVAYRMDPTGITNWERADWKQRKLAFEDPFEGVTGDAPKLLVLDDPGDAGRP